MSAQLTTMRDLVRAFTRAMNLISPEVQNHHEKVSYFAYRLSEAMGCSESERRLTFYGALMHDVGSVMTEGSLSLMDIESRPSELARTGALLLRMFPSTASLSEIVERSQSPWEKLKRLPDQVKAPRRISQMVHLADTVSLLLKEDVSVLNQVGEIRECIHRIGEREFDPAVLSAFDALCERESVWLDLLYRPQLFLDDMPDDRSVSVDETIRLTELMSRIIDFRSPFTAMHSAGVAVTAQTLAALAGMSQDECKQMRIAGNLHDIGKLKIPKSILEKPGKLTDEGFNIMKEHAYYTYILLRDVRGFDWIAQWAAFHHEKLNNKGYPFKLSGDQIPFGSRVMAVADVFSAVAEERPYRKGMEKQKVIEVLRSDAERGALSRPIVELLIEHYDEIDALRDAESRAASKRYQETLKASQGD
ncbi:MAG: HD domain-containing protein [Clostridia bacterium]|nr:HD domain-containing protein [Clostridia bacterium]